MKYVPVKCTTHTQKYFHQEKLKLNLFPEIFQIDSPAGEPIHYPINNQFLVSYELL